jgi:hypothetical protein
MSESRKDRKIKNQFQTRPMAMESSKGDIYAEAVFLPVPWKLGGGGRGAGVL